MWSKFLVLLALLAYSNAQQIDTRVVGVELTDANPNNCDLIVEVSKFSGTCCSINNTANDGCVLNIVNGNCRVSRNIDRDDALAVVGNLFSWCSFHFLLCGRLPDNIGLWIGLRRTRRVELNVLRENTTI